MTGNENHLGNPHIKIITPALRDSEQFRRFQDLTKKLVSVPKSEIDKRREKV